MMKIGSVLKKIFRQKEKKQYYYLVLYDGPHGIGECTLNNEELAELLLDWNPCVISLTPAVPFPRVVNVAADITIGCH